MDALLDGLPAGAEPVEVVKERQRVLGSTDIGVWSEVTRPVFLDIVREECARIVLPDRHLDEGVGLVIHKHCIVLGSVFFDEIAFEDECLNLAVHHDILEVVDKRYHALDLG